MIFLIIGLFIFLTVWNIYFLLSEAIKLTPNAYSITMTDGF